MKTEQFRKLLVKGIKELYATDSQLLDKDLDINERTVTHRLAFHLTAIFKAFDVDCEYNRMIDHKGVKMEGDLFVKKLGLGPITTTGEDDEGTTVYPDIIIHKRKQPINLAVIEVKMKWKKSRKNFDYEKLDAYKNDLKYEFAIYLELDETNYSTEFR